MKEVGGFLQAFYVLKESEEKKVISLSRLDLAALPQSIAKCSNLESLDLSKNRFLSIPEPLCLLPKLKSVDFKGNTLPLVPPLFGDANSGMKMVQFIRDAKFSTGTYKWPYLRCIVLGGTNEERSAAIRAITADLSQPEPRNPSLETSLLGVTEVFLPLLPPHSAILSFVNFDSSIHDFMAFKPFCRDYCAYLVLHTPTTPLTQILAHLSECTGFSKWVMVVDLFEEEWEGERHTRAMAEQWTKKGGSIMEPSNWEKRIEPNVWLKNKGRELTRDSVSEILRLFQRNYSQKVVLKKDYPASYLLLSHYLRSLRTGKSLRLIVPDMNPIKLASILGWETYLQIATAAHVDIHKKVEDVTDLLDRAGVISSFKLGGGGWGVGGGGGDPLLILNPGEFLSGISAVLRGLATEGPRAGVASAEKVVVEFMKKIEKKDREVVIGMMEKYGLLYRTLYQPRYGRFSLSHPPVFSLSFGDGSEEKRSETSLTFSPANSIRLVSSCCEEEVSLSSPSHSPPDSPSRYGSSPVFPSVASTSPLLSALHPSPDFNEQKGLNRSSAVSLGGKKRHKHISDMRRSIAITKTHENILEADQFFVYLYTENGGYSTKGGVRASKETQICEIMGSVAVKRAMEGMGMGWEDVCMTKVGSMEALDGWDTLGGLAANEFVLRFFFFFSFSVFFAVNHSLICSTIGPAKNSQTSKAISSPLLSSPPLSPLHPPSSFIPFSICTNTSNTNVFTLLFSPNTSSSLSLLVSFPTLESNFPTFPKWGLCSL